MFMINKSKEKGWGISMHTAGRTLWCSNLLDNWNSHRREEKMKDHHGVAELLFSGLHVSNKTDVEALHHAGLVEGHNPSKPDWSLPLIIGNMRLNFGGLSFQPEHRQIELFWILWSLVLWDYLAFRKNVEILKNYLQKCTSIKVDDTHRALKVDLSFPRVQEEK